MSFFNNKADNAHEASAQDRLQEYMNSHNYGKQHYSEYSKDPEWQQLDNAFRVEQGMEPIDYNQSGEEQYLNKMGKEVSEGWGIPADSPEYAAIMENERNGYEELHPNVNTAAENMNNNIEQDGLDGYTDVHDNEPSEGDYYKATSRAPEEHEDKSKNYDLSEGPYTATSQAPEEHEDKSKNYDLSEGPYTATSQAPDESNDQSDDYYKANSVPAEQSENNPEAKEDKFDFLYSGANNSSAENKNEESNDYLNTNENTL